MKFELEERLIDFAVSVIKISDSIKDNYAGNHLSHQLIRSSSSTALNYGEARGAASKRDFIHKMTIVLKELRESFNNLKIISKSDLCNDKSGLEKLLKENNELIAVFVSSIKTTRDKS